MPKKFTILLASTLGFTSLVGGALPASALITKDNIKYWGVAEIMDFKAKMQNEIIETCGADENECAISIRQSYYTNQTDQYMAYTAADSELSNFTITSINPATETIKVFITDYERDWMTDSLRVVPLTSAYAVWGESSARDALMGTVSGAGAFYASEIESNSLRDGVYKLFGASRSGNSDVLNVDNVPTMQEIEFHASGSNLMNNLSGEFYSTTLRDSGGDVYSYRSYGSCLESPDYELGKECRIMFGSDGNYTYIPFTVDENTSEEPSMPSEGEDNVLEPSDPTSEPETSTEAASNTTEPSEGVVQAANISTSTSRVPVISSHSVQSTADDSSNVGSSTEKSEDCNYNMAASQSEDSVDLPTAGLVNTQTSSEENYNFPWWIIVFIFSGIAITIWWFIPTKKFEKSVDK